MNLVKTLLATAFALTTATAAFAANDQSSYDEAEKVVVSTQEQPGETTQATDETAAGQSNAAQPATDSAVEAPASQTPQTGQ